MERGQASVEHVGLVLLLALVFSAAVAVAPGAVGGAPSALAQAFCAALDADCERAGEPEPPTEQELVDRLASAPLQEFLAYRGSAERDPRLDYSTDLCSAPIVGSEGRTFDFTSACIRHDFGYRNYSDLGLFKGRRRAVDDRFLADMRALCERELPWHRLSCGTWARTFYGGVRGFGWAAED